MSTYSPGLAQGGMRRGQRGGTALMATVSDKDIMREFASAAAAEAGIGKKSPSDVAGLNGNESASASKPGGGSGAGSEEGKGPVDDARPTGYR